MNQVQKHSVAGATLHLDPGRAIYWEEQDALLVADVHLGKAAHFRAHGLYAPQGMVATELARLQQLLQHYACRHFIILGDLFHSEYNGEWDTFGQWLAGLHGVQVTLVKGNHDILPLHLYRQVGLQVCRHYRQGRIELRHFPTPAEKLEPDTYLLCGHVHPSYSLRGAGRQFLSLRCFWFGSHQGVLPAFGEFTGSMSIAPQEGDQIYLIAGNSVLKAPLH